LLLTLGLTLLDTQRSLPYTYFIKRPLLIKKLKDFHPMNEELRRTGISITAEVPWGTHFRLFYKTKEDLLGILIPYFRAGLEDGEFCMWVTSEPLTKAAIKKAMKKAMPDFDSYVRKGTIEILSYDEWYVQNGVFDINKVLDGWIKKHDRARTMGCSGLRLTGNTFWLEKKDWQDFMAYEEIINNIIGNYRMLAVCTYSIDKCGAAEVIDVARTHQFALVNRGNEWNIITNTKLDHAKEKAEYFASFPQMNSNPVIMNFPVAVGCPSYSSNTNGLGMLTVVTWR